MPLSALPRLPKLLPLALLLVLGACDRGKELWPEDAPPAGPTPQLVPIAPILAQADQLTTARGQQSALSGRDQSLRARADQLRPSEADSLRAQASALQERADPLRDPAADEVFTRADDIRARAQALRTAQPQK